jgi:hypothetical protein
MRLILEEIDTSGRDYGNAAVNTTFASIPAPFIYILVSLSIGTMGMQPATTVGSSKIRAG